MISMLKNIFSLKIWVCPHCKSHLVFFENLVKCTNPNCERIYPTVKNIPILINEDKSLFSISDFKDFRETTFKKSALKEKIKLPSISNNLSSHRNILEYKKLIVQNNKGTKPLVLILGGGIMTASTEILICDEILLIESDVSFATRTEVIIDAHDIPLTDASVDGVILQAVLEHVIDPFRVIKEVERILKLGGLIYAATPFMQQVHMRNYDFMRFTHLGHRKLLQNFTEIESGPFAGSGVALAWSAKYFLLNFFENKFLRKIAGFICNVSFFWLKYFDYILKNKKGIYDSASGYYFLGSKDNKPIPDKEIIKKYKGAF